MSVRIPAFLRCMGALLLLLGCTWVVEIATFLVLWRGQTLPAYGFFANQAYDFLAKIRWFGDSMLGWAPALPDRFAGLELTDKITALLPLLPATLVTAIVVGAVGGLVCAVAARRPAGSVRRDLLVWTAFGILVHLAASIPGFRPEEGLRLSHLPFRARSLVIDGMALSTCILLASFVIARALAPVFARSPTAAGLGLLALFVLAGVGATAQVAGSPVTPAASLPALDPGQPRRNVVLISLDSLRADHVGAYGYERDTSPNFDRFAREGVLFRNAIATSSWTLPTHITMFTGRSQVSHGVFEDTRVLSPAVATLGEIFHAAGYATAGFVSGPYVAGHYGYARGMDTYIDLSAGWGKGAEARAAILSPEINEKGLAWLEEFGSQPFFLFLHYFDIHYDFVPPPPYDKMFDPDYTGTMDGRFFIERKDVHANMPARDLEHIKALYDGEIRYTDEHVGRVLDRLRAKGLLDSTVVMIVADHGDEFFEHGNKGHHRTVYDEVLHVPFALRLPGAEHAGRTIDSQVSLIDVFPTLLGAAGFPVPAEAEGENLVAWIRGDDSDREAIYADFYDKRGFNLQVARRTPASKTIQHFNRITHPKRGPIEFFTLANDAAESDNRADQNPGDVDASIEAMSGWLESQWRSHRRTEALTGDDASIEIDEETKKRLESLGYVGE